MMPTEVSILAEMISSAKRPEDIFGELSDDPNSAKTEVARDYRKMSRAIHPDRHGGSAEASDAFATLANLRDKALERIANGTYGQAATATVRTKRHEYAVGNALPSSGVANCYECVIDGTGSGVFTVARQPVDNDLMSAEAKALKLLCSPSSPDARGYLPMLPELVESFTYGEAGGVHRLANVFATHEGFVSLAEIQQAYPDGIHPADMAWMWRRLLDVLGYSHSRGVIHGAVLPHNVLIGLGDVHDVVLTNWQASLCDPVENGERIAVIDETYEDWYPPEVAAKQPPTESLDILMSARCMVAVLGGNPVNGLTPDRVHVREQGFLQSCLFTSPSQRPQNAWQLREEFGELLTKLRGRVYRPFFMPT